MSCCCRLRRGSSTDKDNFGLSYCLALSSFIAWMLHYLNCHKVWCLSAPYIIMNTLQNWNIGQEHRVTESPKQWSHFTSVIAISFAAPVLVQWTSRTLSRNSSWYRSQWTLRLWGNTYPSTCVPHGSPWQLHNGSQAVPQVTVNSAGSLSCGGVHWTCCLGQRNKRGTWSFGTAGMWPSG